MNINQILVVNSASPYEYSTYSTYKEFYKKDYAKYLEKARKITR